MKILRIPSELIYGLRSWFHPKDEAINAGDNDIFAKHIVASESFFVGVGAGFEAETGNIALAEQASSPATPTGGAGVIYCKTDGKLYFKNDAGSETALT